LFDEPLSNLDAELRTQMRVEIAKLHRTLGVTMIYVTHDQVEAMTLADRIVVLRDGLVEQIGTPTEIYDHPANLFVAGFIGSPKMNFIKATVVQNGAEGFALVNPAFAGGSLKAPVHANGRLEAGAPVTVGVRPDNLQISASQPILELTAELAENLGGATQIYASAPEAPGIALTIAGRPDVKPGDRLSVGLGSGRIYVFDKDGRAI
jgi:lactose/L-arabinose transport system ATP-binding protein